MRCVRKLLSAGCTQSVNEAGERPLNLALLKADQEYPDTDEGKLLHRAAWDCVVALGGEMDKIKKEGASSDELAREEQAQNPTVLKQEEHDNARRIHRTVTAEEIFERYRIQYGQPNRQRDSADQVDLLKWYAGDK